MIARCTVQFVSIYMDGLIFVLCPKCKTDNAHRSHRQGVLENVASIFTYYPYRCRECKHRFLHLRHETVEAPEPGQRSTEREIRATRQAKDWHRKRRDLAIYGTALLLFLAFLYFITRERSTPDSGNAAPLPSTGSRKMIRAGCSAGSGCLVAVGPIYRTAT